MALVKTFDVQVWSQSGEEHLFKFKINVLSNGNFRGVVPRDFQLEGAGAMAQYDADNLKVSAHWVTKDLEKKGVYYVESKDLEVVESVLTNIARLRFHSQEKTELVIAVLFESRYLVFVNKQDGRIVPGRGSVDDLPENADRHHHDYWDEWKAEYEPTTGLPHSGYNASAISFALSANVYLKSIVEVGDQRQVTYKRWSEISDASELGQYGTLVTQFNMQPIDTRFRSRNQSLQAELPYTEDTAKFVYESLLGMVKMARAMKTYFGSAESISRAMSKLETHSGYLALKEAAHGEEED